MPVEKLVPYLEKQLSAAGLWKPEYESSERDWLLKTVDLLRQRFTLLTDFTTRGAAYFSDQFEIEPRAAQNLDKDGARELLRGLGDELAAAAEFSEERVEQHIRDYAAKHNAKPGLIINAARAALTGQSVGPSAFALFAALGKQRVVERLRKV
jgi:glutamyl-tRNA synthetase